MKRSVLAGLVLVAATTVALGLPAPGIQLGAGTYMLNQTTPPPPPDHGGILNLGDPSSSNPGFWNGYDNTWGAAWWVGASGCYELPDGDLLYFYGNNRWVRVDSNGVFKGSGTYTQVQ